MSALDPARAIDLISDAYMELLRAPTRHLNQPFLCAVRAYLADAFGADEQLTQDFYEYLISPIATPAGIEAFRVQMMDSAAVVGHA